MDLDSICGSTKDPVIVDPDSEKSWKSDEQ